MTDYYMSPKILVNGTVNIQIIFRLKGHSSMLYASLKETFPLNKSLASSLLSSCLHNCSGWPQSNQNWWVSGLATQTQAV